MASAEKRTVVEEVTTQVEVEVIDLELSIEEAQVLREVLGRIGGSAGTRIRKVATPLYWTLGEVVDDSLAIKQEITSSMRVDTV